MQCIYCGHSKTHKRGKTSRGQGKYQRYFCSICHKSFSELTGTVYQNRHLTPEDIDLILRCERQGMSFNEAAKQVGVCPRTVSNIIEICQRKFSRSANGINFIEAQIDINSNEKLSASNIINVIIIRN
jgi:transposase-like protein